jgi:hypothetical protein
LNDLFLYFYNRLIYYIKNKNFQIKIIILISL